MAAAVSLSTTSGTDEGADSGPTFVSRPFSANHDLATDKENFMSGDRHRHPEFASVEEDATSGPECQRRVDEDLVPLSPEDIESRLERTRREFYNRRKIIIKNLPPDVTNQEVHELLGNYDLKYCFVDKYKGTAFVTLLNGEQAQCAIKEFHQIMLREREISVQLQPTDTLLCIANLPRAFTQQQFEELVRPFGNLERCFLVYSASTGHSKGYGFVEYMKKDSAARAKSELLGKQLGSRMLYVHWTEVGSLTYPQLHSKCLCVDRLPPNLLTAQDLRNALADTHSPVFCQLAQGQDGSFRRFAVLEFATAEMTEEAQRLGDGRLLGGTHIRVSFCAPGPPGRSMLAALIAAQTMAVNRGKGLLPDPTAMQLFTGLNNPATLKMLLNTLSQGHKQGLLGAAPAIPLLPNPALSAALLQLLLQNQAKQAFLGNHLLWAQVLHSKEKKKIPVAGLIGDNPLAALPVQQGVHLLGELPQGGMVPGLALQTEAVPSLKPGSLGRGLMREQDSPTSACSFPQTPSCSLPGISLPLMGGMMGADGLTAQGVCFKVDVRCHTYIFFPSKSLMFPFAAAASSRPHPYRKRPTLNNVSNQHTHHNMQPNYNLRYQDSYSPDEFSTFISFSYNFLLEFLQFSHQPNYSEHFSHYACPSSPPLSSYFSSGPEASSNGSLPATHLNKAVGMPPVTHSAPYSPGLGNVMKTPMSSQKRVFSRLIPSPEPSPEGGYVGQHSQGLGGHYADSYLKRKRIF
uniref:Ribonucleoprotein PTB-binding 1 n=1 Tax=Xiphophorus couchianus TaxID=32473 RepID=A0A3B5MLA1_9TELE